VKTESTGIDETRNRLQLAPFLTRPMRITGSATRMRSVLNILALFFIAEDTRGANKIIYSITVPNPARGCVTALTI